MTGPGRRGASERPDDRKQRNKGRYLLMKWYQSFCSGHRCHRLGGCAEAMGRRVHCWGCLSLGTPWSPLQGLGAPPCTPGNGHRSHVVVSTQDKERPFKATKGRHWGWPDMGTDPSPLQDTRVKAAPAETPQPSSPHSLKPRHRRPKGPDWEAGPGLGFRLCPGLSWEPGLARLLGPQFPLLC